MEEKKKQEEEKRKTRGSRTDLSEFPNRRRNMILAGVFALISMVGYAVATGLIQVQITDKDSGPVVSKEMAIPTNVSHSPRFVSQNVLLEEPEEVS